MVDYYDLRQLKDAVSLENIWQNWKCNLIDQMSVPACMFDHLLRCSNTTPNAFIKRCTQLIFGLYAFIRP